MAALSPTHVRQTDLHDQGYAISPGRVLHLGSAVAQGSFGDLLFGEFWFDSRFVHASLLLPCPDFRSVARFRPDTSGSVTLTGAVRVKARRAAESTLHRLDASLGGHLQVESEIPDGMGFGSAACDVVASIRAVANAVGRVPSEHVVAEVAASVGAELGSVSSARAQLISSEDGVLLDDLGGSLPVLKVVGFEGVMTRSAEAFPPRYGVREHGRLRAAHGLLRYAIARSDAALLGSAATACARVNDALRPRRNFTCFVDLAIGVGACGVQLAQRANTMSALFDPLLPDLDARICELLVRAEALGLGRARSFLTAEEVG